MIDPDDFNDVMIMPVVCALVLFWISLYLLFSGEICGGLQMMVLAYYAWLVCKVMLDV